MMCNVRIGSSPVDGPKRILARAINRTSVSLKIKILKYYL
jgi:hypothetical protein